MKITTVIWETEDHPEFLRTDSAAKSKSIPQLEREPEFTS